MRRADKDVSVTVPEDSGVGIETPSPPILEEVRESIRVQALLAEIRSEHGYANLAAPR